MLTLGLMAYASGNQDRTEAKIREDLRFVLRAVEMYTADHDNLLPRSMDSFNGALPKCPDTNPAAIEKYRDFVFNYPLGYRRLDKRIAFDHYFDSRVDPIISCAGYPRYTKGPIMLPVYEAPKKRKLLSFFNKAETLGIRFDGHIDWYESPLEWQAERASVGELAARAGMEP
ncbi:MAG TPA: hypothetical protein PLH94_03895 [Fimbriimonadaceae bacterium]|nr:hypothetical protein [Fimbriimonadaceae bacterium]